MVGDGDGETPVTGLSAGTAYPRTPRPTARLGRASVFCAIGMVTATIAGSLLAAGAGAVVSTPLAVLALALSLAAVVTGLIAALRGGPGRVPGIVGLVIGVLLDPALLAILLPQSLP